MYLLGCIHLPLLGFLTCCPSSSIKLCQVCHIWTNQTNRLLQQEQNAFVSEGSKVVYELLFYVLLHYAP